MAARDATRLPRAALVYDFDGTLAPHNLPEHSLLPFLGVPDAAGFWRDCEARARLHDSDQVLTWMWMLVEAGERAGRPLSRDLLREHGARTPLFAGVEGWFDDIAAHGRAVGLEVEHYVVSSGLLEMIEGCAVHDRFRKVFASSYAYDAAGRATWPASAINYTTKTQYLFRINKGIGNVWDNSTINLWMPEDQRHVPFRRMVFLGDGDTDIPSMKLVREKGGQAVAVFDPEKFERRLSQGHLERLIAEDRIDHVASADYRPGALLSSVVKGILGRMARRAAD